jgi:hypothetical protein
MANDGRFKKGSTPWNKGKKDFRPSPETEFKSGENHTGDKHPSWKGGVQKFKNDCAYIWTGNGKRVRRPRAIYEANFGPIPKGFVIVHKDGNKDNDHPLNLEAISRAENMKRNSNRRTISVVADGEG